MPEVEVDNNNEKPSEINRFHIMIISSSKNVLKMEEEVEVSKKRKFQTDQSDELSLLPLSKHACFANVACSDNTNVSSEIDTAYSMSYVNSTTSMECNNDIEMKEESSGSCGEDKMISFESHLDYIYGTQNLEDFSDKVIENILYLDEQEEEEEAKGCSSNAAKFVLSSGRWTVNQDSSTLHETKKPTIDQEFEQYFSTLML
ncbi:protein FAR-RED ELONGATED HYPOCOTYL 1 isoform X2 [Arabidopsis lyrata subsp. lyrata]|uniref:protein FAR-RED ELONGATED HYPOCOTYL 1 isoform X2 n=1 Tax=Arabidopsis lyrata subsp. lyrata TaxID=81972 RepID=UPI000A29C844|nr:protein FAR-RED ELONGATED HYPOCOTYL 1 isoform X2 [Arabidopsis lyrata subsp. lyrata]|eukprot:XP_020885727.1 protein FAR-RED ELONGATED HYPOCOTYL 1 isoform X2 [Arabidopsis lyrata subsp. lyrata]